MSELQRLTTSGKSSVMEQISTAHSYHWPTASTSWARLGHQEAVHTFRIATASSHAYSRYSQLLPNAPVHAECCLSLFNCISTFHFADVYHKMASCFAVTFFSGCCYLYTMLCFSFSGIVASNLCNLQNYDVMRKICPISSKGIVFCSTIFPGYRSQHRLCRMGSQATLVQ